jgi:hypothetical protein
MMNMEFEGWWQCRFATDPDPSDDPRGVSGPTFVVAGEEPLDRIIRWQSPRFPRYPMQKSVGVSVRRVTLGDPPVEGTAPNAVAVADHPLVGAAVDLLDDPQFLQRNLVLVREAFTVFIDPFHIQVGVPGSTPVLSRAALWDVTRPDLTINDVYLDEQLLAPRANAIAVQSVEVAEATGIVDYSAYRAERLAVLQTKRDVATDLVEQAALDRRILALTDDKILAGVRLASTQFLGMQASYSFPLNGDPVVEDPGKKLGGRVGTSQVWPLVMWWGGYDVDTMCGYVKGTLSVPFVASAAAAVSG